MPKATKHSTTKKKSKAAPREADPTFAALENHKNVDPLAETAVQEIPTDPHPGRRFPK